MQFKISKEKIQQFLEETEKVEVPFLYRKTSDGKEEIILTNFPDTKELSDEKVIEIEIDKPTILKLLLVDKKQII